jgi:hypothetical protein
MIMFKKYTPFVSILVFAMIVLSSCNLPTKVTDSTQTDATQSVMSINTPTPPPSLCNNLYYPNSMGDSWEYNGSTSATGDFTRTDAITNSSDQAFTVQSNLSGITYMVDYSCTETGLIAVNPIQQYLGAILSSLNGQVSLNLVSNSGISLPNEISPGDTWQQIVEWEGSAQGISTNGRLVFDYTATGYETVTVPAGTYESLKVNTSIRIEISSFRLQYGTYEMTTWMAPNVGVIKSEGRSNVPNVEFSDNLELTSFTAAQ